MINLSGKHTDILYTLWPHMCMAFPTITILHQSGTFLIIIEPTLTHYYHPSLWSILGFTLVVIHSIGFNK